MSIPDTLGQPLTFDSSLCSDDDCQRIVIGNNENCPGLQNPFFTGNPVNFWTLSAGLTQVADPLQVTGVINVSHTIATTGIFEAGDYTVTLDITNNEIGTVNVAVNGSLLPGAFTDPQFVLGASTTQRVTANVTMSVTGTWTITVAVRANPGQPNLDVTLNYISICPVNQNNTSFCFQLPLIVDGDEILELTDEEIGFGALFTYTIDTQDNPSTTGAACPAPFNSFSQVLMPAVPIVDGGLYFHEVKFDDITITYGINYSDDTASELVLSARDGTLAREDEQDFTESDANTDILFKGTDTWVAADTPSLWIKARSECDGTDEQIDYDVNFDEWSMYPSFFEDTFSATDDTFYRLTFDLSKTSNVTVTVTDSLSNELFKASETGPSFNKIFDTATLAAGSPDTLTIRWEVADLAEYPNASFNSAVLQNVQLFKMCKWNASIETTAEVFDSNLAETHDTTAETTGDSYHKNIQYCIDTATLDDSCYQFRIENSCDTNIQYTSNCVQVCKSECELSRIAWDHENIKFVGSQCLDYVAYNYESFLYVKIDFQDLTQEWEGVIYKDAAGFLQQPWSFFRNTKVMQIWPLPGWARAAIATALQDTFTVNGIEYRKLDDEAIVPQFNATDPAPVRILVAKVGDFVESKNL